MKIRAFLPEQNHIQDKPHEYIPRKIATDHVDCGRAKWVGKSAIQMRRMRVAEIPDSVIRNAGYDGAFDNRPHYLGHGGLIKAGVEAGRSGQFQYPIPAVGDHRIMWLKRFMASQVQAYA